MSDPSPFNWRHFEAETILLCIRWYLRIPLSYRDLEELLLERGISVDHTTIYRWVQRNAPELERRCRPHLKLTTDSWRVDETSVKVKGTWMYLSRAVDSAGTTLEFWLSQTRDAEAAKRFFSKALGARHTVTPRVITVDKNEAYPSGPYRTPKRGRHSLLLRTAAGQISQHPRRARPPLHQALSQARAGVLFVCHRLANLARGRA